MTMQETENDILKDLEELGDTISQYTFLIACAGECAPFDESLRTEENLVRECQVRTWLYVQFEDGKLRFETDSEALIVKGAMALLQELYNGRSLEEVKGYHCRLLDSEDFTRHFNMEQLKGIRAIIGKLESLE